MTIALLEKDGLIKPTDKITGKKIGEFLKNRIFSPLGMDRTFTAETKPIQLHFAQSYQTENSANVPFPSTSCDRIEGDGGVFSTTADMARWFSGLSNFKIVDQKTLENKIFSATKTSSGEVVSYGYGWFLMKDEKARPIYHHGGGWLGFHYSVVYSPSEKIWLVILSNHTDFGPPARDMMADAILEMSRN